MLHMTRVRTMDGAIDRVREPVCQQETTGSQSGERARTADHTDIIRTPGSNRRHGCATLLYPVGASSATCDDYSVKEIPPGRKGLSVARRRAMGELAQPRNAGAGPFVLDHHHSC